MKQFTLPGLVVDICTFEELGGADKSLIRRAREVTTRSYSPYSGFRVGCAILLKPRRSSIHVGSNFENASFGITCCAERNAIFSLGSKGLEDQIARMAITARPAGADSSYVGAAPVAPCGACRQVIKEVEDLAGKPITILMDCFDDRKIYRVEGISALLPLAFGPADFVGT